jgi:hypothetical protein
LAANIKEITIINIGIFKIPASGCRPEIKIKNYNKLNKLILFLYIIDGDRNSNGDY